MLIIKKRNIQKGFSLIELMVAVVILAIAILGIYQAYSLSFTGMSDARDRTVATNYVREAMEGIKNMDFDKIITQSRSYITGSKYKYEREVIVQESTNLKKVTTKVYWRDRNGNKKMVETGMSVHFMQTSEGTATRIMLIANPYNVLPGGISTITAVIKDAKGNTVTIWTGDISFTSNSGGLQPNSVSLTLENGGKASTTFTAPSDEGEVNIMASANGLTPDSVIIKVTEPKKPVKINLTANRTYMTADTSSTSEITATIADAGGETVTESNNVITFSVSGPGTLSAVTSTAPTDGIAKITLTSNGTPGTITVTASSTGLVPGVVNVITGGKISLSASRFSVPVNETSKITVTTKDVNGVPIKYVGTINLEISPNPDGAGIFENDLNTIEVYFDGSTSSNTITFTGTSEGIVNINAEDQAGILTSADPLSLTITPAPVPDHIAVTANPSIIKAGGTETSTITAEIKTEYNNTITGYTDLITFTTTEGTFPNGVKVINTNDTVNVTYENGVAKVELFPPTNRGSSTITVSSGELANVTVEVKFYTDPDHINLAADPPDIYAGGETSTITATIVDKWEDTIDDYEGTVNFSITSGDDSGKFNGDTTATSVVDNGIAVVTLQSTNNPGTVTVKAEDSSLPHPSSTIDITVKEVPLKLVGSVSYTPDPGFYIITFNIEIDGPKLNLNSMKVEWDLTSPPSRLKKIEIKSPSTTGIYETIMSGNKSSPYTTEDDINKDLLPGESTIRLTFSRDMRGVSVKVIFYTHLGDFSIEF